MDGYMYPPYRMSLLYSLASERESHGFASALADQRLGDVMQYMTNSYLPSTPHKVGLNTRERYALAYFHEPDFKAVVRPLESFDAGQSPKEGIHYGTHFTNMFMRSYPERITTKRLIAEDRYKLLKNRELREI